MSTPGAMLEPLTLDARTRETSTHAPLRSLTLSSVATTIGQQREVDISCPLSEIQHVLEHSEEMIGILVTDAGRLVAVLSKDSIAAGLSRPYALQLFLNRPVELFLETHGRRPLALPPDTDISVAIAQAIGRSADQRYEPIVTTTRDDRRCLIDVPTLLLHQCQALEDTVAALEQQQAATAAAERDRARLHGQLMDASRDAGRAEVATGILHNVGNVLNSINVSRATVSRMLERSKVGNLTKAVGLIADHRDNLAAFLVSDARGRELPSYLGRLAETLIAEHDGLTHEVDELGQNIEHIRQVVATQQSYAKNLAVTQDIHPTDLMDDAARMNLMSFERHNVAVDRQYSYTGTAWLDRHKVLQILINLISNAKNAAKQRSDSDRHIALIVERRAEAGGEIIRFVVHDNGVGIAPENLTSIFAHGFTTRKDGHGFGLHSAANLAKELGGSLRAESDGPGKGARFTLDLPVVHPAEPRR